jgi:P4 family phage/plasmid primase-like protien
VNGGTSPEAAEHARLAAETAAARARYQDLQANRPDPGDTGACTAHRALESAASEAIFNAQYAAEAYLREHPDAVPVYGAARRWHAMGVSTIPVKDDGSKEPLVRWKQYQGVLPPEDELWRWHHGGDSSIAALTGERASDDGLRLEMFEFEGRSVSEGIFDAFLDAIKEAGLGEVWQRILAGYWDMSPSGGPRFWYLCEDVCGNTKLASRPSTTEELAEKPDDPVKTLIETRGLGGYAVVAPTSGKYHDLGKPWLAMGGPPASLAVVTPAEREQFFAIARAFNTAPSIAARTRKARAKYETLDGPVKAVRAKARPGDGSEAGAKPSTRPGDIYNERGPAWAELLKPDGWLPAGTGSDGELLWTRPGKDRGTSATTGHPAHDGDKLHVFSSGTQLEQGEAYSKFAYYAITHHDSDFAAAAAQLNKEGFTVKEATTSGAGADEEITDSHLADQFAAAVLAGKFCWVSGWGWMAYRQARNRERRGSRWYRTDDKEMTDLARTWLLSTYEAVKEDNPKLSAGEKKAWRSQLAGRHVKEVLSLAAGVRGIRRDIAEFDTHHDLLNCANGVLDLRTSELLAHDPALMFTKSTGVDYVPGATHPDWTTALSALPEQVRDWYQVRLGQAATGYVPPDDVMLLQTGEGENGKTTVVQGLRHGFGDYYTQIPVKALLGSHQEHDTVLMVFKGARLAVLEETPEEGRLSYQQLKQITAPQITGRLMYQNYVTYDTTHAAMISTNHEPAAESADHGSLRRVQVVGYPYRYLKPGQPLVLPADRAGDPGLRQRIIDGADGQHEAILAWMASGARGWYEAGRVMPAMPEPVQADTSAWLDRMNLIFTFAAEHLKRDTDGRRIMAAELWKFFRTSIGASGNSSWSERTFNRRLAEFATARGWVIEKKKTRHVKELLSQPPADFPEDPPASYQAWHGVRFKNEEDLKAEEKDAAP